MNYSSYVKSSCIHLNKGVNKSVFPLFQRGSKGNFIAISGSRRRLKKTVASLILLATAILVTACSPSLVVGWSGPSVEGDVVYLGTMTGKVVAYDSANGDPRWQAALPAPSPASGGFGCAPQAARPMAFYGNPSTDADSVFIGSYDGTIYALNKTTGAVKWQYPRVDHIGAIVGGVAVSQGMVFAGSSDGKLYALSASNGTEQWTFATGHKIWNTPAIKDNRLYVGSFDGNLYALNPADGSLIWKFETEGAITADPVVVGNTVYVGSFDRRLYAVDTNSGKPRWSFQGEGWFWSAPVVKDNLLVAGNLDGNVYALEASNGNKLWKYETKGAVRPSPALVGDTVVAVSEDKNVYYLRSSSGSLIRAIPLASPVLASLAVQKGLVYVYSRQGLLIAFNVENGVRVWEVATGG